MTERTENTKIKEWVPTGKKIFITGATGLVGTAVVKAAAGKDQLVGLSRGKTRQLFSEEKARMLYGDLLDEDFLRIALIAAQPDIVLHTAAIANVDWCQIPAHYEDAMAMNFTATLILSRICRELSIPIIGISTDYVFPRWGGPFGVHNVPFALLSADGREHNVYGYTKRLSEFPILQSPGSGLVMRIVSPYDGENENKCGVPPLLKKSIESHKPIMAVCDAKTTYTFVGDITLGINKIIREKLWERESVVHIAGPEQLSAYEVALRIKSHFPQSQSEIRMVTSDHYFKGQAPRPIDGGLKGSIIEGRTIEEVLF